VIQAKKPAMEQRKRKVIPPVYLLLAFGLMEALHYLAPLGRFIEPPYSYLGAVPLLAGLFMSATAAGSFRKAGTPVVPFEPSTVLVTSGFFRYTRNPMYLGMVLMLVGVALLLGSLGPLVVIPVFVWIIQSNFIRGEEQFLEDIFGEQYLSYKRKVRRWI
jgi:protein-S-isoprenylcysteine O-methyltransferase Ste14